MWLLAGSAPQLSAEAEPAREQVTIMKTKLLEDLKKDALRQKLLIKFHEKKIKDGEEKTPSGRQRQPQIDLAKSNLKELKDFKKFIK